MWAILAVYEGYQWTSSMLPTVASHTTTLLELAVSAAASLGGVVLVGVVIAGAASLFNRLTRIEDESTASTGTTVQPSQETES